MKETLTEVANTLLEKSVTIEVDILNPGWFEKFLIKLKIIPAKRKLQIKPLSLGTIIKISNELLGVEINNVEEQNFLRACYTALQQNGHKLAVILAIALIGSKSDPPDKLIKFLSDNLTPAELFKIVSIIVSKMDVGNFYHSMVLISGVNLLTNTSPKAPDNKPFGQPLAD
jgi:hypothetical protein